jgi:hypothetical protein
MNVDILEDIRWAYTELEYTQKAEELKDIQQSVDRSKYGYING